MASRSDRGMRSTDKARPVDRVVDPFDELAKLLPTIEWHFRVTTDRSSFTKNKLKMKRAQGLYYRCCAIDRERAKRLWDRYARTGGGW